MKMVKSLLLGSAAGLVAMTGAQAADLPVKAKPVQYVKICSLYGAGFYYIPGTDTCLKVGGAVRVEADIYANGSFNPYRVQNFSTPAMNKETTRARGYMSLDARSQTEYGTLRGYILTAAMNTNAGGAPGGNAYNVPYAPAIFIQFAGFTAGATASFFDFDGQPYSNETAYWSSAQGGNGQPLLGYTAQFGNGFSATLSLEDTTGRQSSITGNGFGYAGRRWPDLVGNLRIDQAWGGAQIMGAVHNVNAFTAAGVTSNATGFAVGGGIKLNAPMIGKGDYFIGQVAYEEGATNYIAVNSGVGGVGAVLLTSGFPVVTNSAIGPIVDAVGTTAADITTSHGWAFTAGYEHFWNSKWKSSLYGGYGRITYDAASSLVLAAAAGAGAAGSASWSSWNIGSRTVFTPVENLDLSVDILYTNVNGAFGGSTNGVNTYGDKDFVSGIVRAQRNFWP